MLWGRLRLSDADISVIGIRRADLARLVDGGHCYTRLQAPLAAGTVMLLGADSHEEMAQAIEATGVKVPLVVDAQDMGEDAHMRPELN